MLILQVIDLHKCSFYIAVISFHNFTTKAKQIYSQERKKKEHINENDNSLSLD